MLSIRHLLEEGMTTLPLCHMPYKEMATKQRTGSGEGTTLLESGLPFPHCRYGGARWPERQTDGVLRGARRGHPERHELNGGIR